MFEVIMINNETGQKFSKGFSSYYMFQKFLAKAKRSKKVTIVYSGQV